MTSSDKAAPRAGQPTKYNPELTERICERLSDGQSLREICKSEGMPSRATVLRWLRVHDEFRDQYAQAREVQADTIVDEILEIADDARNDWMERQGDDGAGVQVNSEHIQRARLRIDARKWVAAKLRPKKYGDRVQTEVSGPDGGPVPITVAERIIVKPGDMSRQLPLAGDTSA